MAVKIKQISSEKAIEYNKSTNDLYLYFTYF